MLAQKIIFTGCSLNYFIMPKILYCKRTCLNSTSQPTLAPKTDAPPANNKGLVSKTPIRGLNKFHKKYKMSSLLGTGGFGSVYICREIQTKLHRAVKIVESPRASKQTFCTERKMMVPTEIVLWEALIHPSIVQLKEVYFDEEENKWYMVMEYDATYQDLYNYTDNHGALSTRDSSLVIQQLVRVMLYLHSNGVDHRDIKDENILYNPKTKKIKLIDFGTAVPLISAPYTSLRGTDLYIPPEYYLYKKYNPAPAVVWAVGCLSFILLRADIPFKNKESVRDFKSLGDFKDCKLAVGTKRVDFIKQCLDPDADTRILMGELLEHPWLKL